MQSASHLHKRFLHVENLQAWKSPAYRLYDRKLAEIDVAPSVLPANYFHTKSPRANLIFWEKKNKIISHLVEVENQFLKDFCLSKSSFHCLALMVSSSTLSLNSIHEAISEMWICIKLIIFCVDLSDMCYIIWEMGGWKKSWEKTDRTAL